MDKAALNGTPETANLDSAGALDSKGDFASLIAKAQSKDKGPADKGSAEKGAAESAVNKSGSSDRSAKSLATESDSSIKEDGEKKGDELPPNDFLLRLQDSLKLDTSLVTPAIVAAAPADGNLLPQEGEPHALEAGDYVKPSATDKPALPSSVAAGTMLEKLAAASAQTGSIAQKSESSQVVVEEEVVEKTGEGQSASTLKGETELKGQGEPVPASKGDKPLSGAERVAQLAKLMPTGESAPVSKPETASGSQVVPDSEMDSAVPLNKGQAAQTTPAQGQSEALKTFHEGLKQADGTAQNGSQGGAQGDGKSAGQQTTADSNPAPTAQSAREGAATAPVSVTTQSAQAPAPASAEPVMVAPQQVLAQVESQGPQAPLSTISAGIQQMEAAGATPLRKSAQLDVKPKVDSANQSVVVTEAASESSQSQSVQHSQNSQPQVQVAENRTPSAAEGALRREPQNLPHLKLAGQEAPAELHQKVNLMLADKLQQAEIQLDPIGLGKMKIQIQIDASSQASVHFVVQHGQTREMLEQAMPRLRDMLAGQGIQLGQTQVQHQSQQQQQQGQATSGGQGQQGQSGGQSGSGRGQETGDVTTSTLNVLVESTNGSGIDFYA
ncbi:flagellar hook-length control protein FliK [Aeromonas jandaei]|uniref:flagellar hook-length control protein FliK n=1 Tax=Aeromonas jandaei TaxID=650 RepID=UPI000A84112C|nr:flagellar hook-length control protein FliK [Aeromonas jandaei]UCA33846.1 flagellar hook-length control protein FliK [Aeromonas jandaei]